MPFAPGELFAGYRIERELGRGGMGSVFLAQHPRLPRREALKLLSPSLSADPAFRTRFGREADLVAQLTHRNIVTVYDRGAADGQLWIAMQYVKGTDASHALRSSGVVGLDPVRVVHIIGEVASGLDFAHRNNLLHRDVKPANILLAASSYPDDPEEVLLTDFGIAKLVDDSQQLTGTGNLLATLAYASPEQIEGRSIDHRVDVYALGCVLYELLTGKVPFPSDNPYGTMTSHLSKPPPRPSQVRPELPREFDDVVARAMAKRASDRFDSCRDLARAARGALAAWEGSHPVSPAPTPVANPRRPEGQHAPGVHPSNSNTPTTVVPAVVLGSGSSGAGSTGVASGDVGRRGSLLAAAEHHSGETQMDQAGTTEVMETKNITGAGPTTQGTSTGPRPPYTFRIERFVSESISPTVWLGPVNTDKLGPGNRVALEELLAKVRFFELPGELPMTKVVADDIFETITVVAGAHRWVVGYLRFGSKHPPELDAIVRCLEGISRWQAAKD